MTWKCMVSSDTVINPVWLKPGLTQAVPCPCGAAVAQWWPWLGTATIPALRDLHFALLTWALHQLDLIPSALAVLFPLSLNGKHNLRNFLFRHHHGKDEGRFCGCGQQHVLNCFVLSAAVPITEPMINACRLTGFDTRLCTPRSCYREEEGASEQWASEQEIKHS